MYNTQTHTQTDLCVHVSPSSKGAPPPPGTQFNAHVSC